jgi:hypothetical protein
MDDFIDSSLPAWTTVASTATTYDDGSTAVGTNNNNNNNNNTNNNTNNNGNNRRQRLRDKIQTQQLLTHEKLQKRKQQAGNALKNFGSQLQKINLVRL